MKLNKFIYTAPPSTTLPPFVLMMIVMMMATLIAAVDDATQQALLDYDDQQQQQQHSNPLGFVDRVLGPIESTLDQSRNFLDDKVVDNIKGQLNQVQLRAYRLFLRAFNKPEPSSTGELGQRAGLFFNRREAIRDSIRAYAEGRDLFSMRLNEFVDWNDEELKRLTGVSLPAPEDLLPEERRILYGSEEFSDKPARGRFKRSLASNATFGGDENGDIGLYAGASIPARIDWRQSGCVAEPIDQINCGACYAIATMGTLEVMRCLHQNSGALLSAQQIVDCSSGYKNFGCNGGWPTRVLKYLQDKKVASRETCYPFVGRQKQCRLRQVAARPGCSVRASVANGRGPIKFKVLNNERDILYYVATQGPVVTVMRATNKFIYYGQGIFDDKTCSRRKDDVDHAIQIVGYGKENGVDYWLIKNSWGKNWGQRGYGKYLRGAHACSIGYWGWAILP